MFGSERTARLTLLVVLALGLSLALPSAALAASHGMRVGSVYVMSNETANTVIQFQRDAKGRLWDGGTFMTGGAGTGAGLGSQGALVRSHDGKWLFAVNAGSDELSVFSIGERGHLRLVSRASTVGSMPVSVTVSGRLAYVLNGGGSGSIAGFRVSTKGHLTYIPGSAQPLSNLGVGAAPVAEQIGFKPWGDTLVVTEKSTNMIDVYGLTSGVAGPPVTFVSNVAAPYGFGFSKAGILVISEAGINALSSYAVVPTMLSVISPSVVDAGLAPCWVVVSPDGRYVYTSDAHSNDVSIYRLMPDGTLTVKTSPAVTVATPLDLDTAHNGRFLFVLSAGSHQVARFGVRAGGALAGLGSFGTLPASATGLVAWWVQPHEGGTRLALGSCRIAHHATHEGPGS